MENSLASLFPEIAAEWDYDANNPLRPENIARASNQKVSWRCSKNPNHKWKSQVFSRVNGHGCPYCSGRLAFPGESDLATINPKLASEWHPTKNGNLTPKMVKANAAKKVWWQCPKNPQHEWEALIHSRNQGKGCPYCCNRAIIAGENDLATTYPDLAIEWHPSHNGNLTPLMVATCSSKKVWWRCANCGNEWASSIYNRTNGAGCPYCAGVRPTIGKTDLATTHPALVAEWHPIKNKKMTPQMVSAGSEVRIWWQCQKCSGEWETHVFSRVSGTGCPYCCNLKATVEKNDLVTVHPGLALEWNYKKNPRLTPQMVTRGSARKVWWTCAVCGCEWEAIISHRSMGHCKCPRCNGRETTSRKYI